MYEDEKEEVIHDTDALDKRVAEIQTDDAIVKHLRALVQQEIAKKFDDGPGVDNDIEELIKKNIDDFLEGYTLEEKIKEVCQGMLDDCYVEINTTGYISN